MSWDLHLVPADHGDDPNEWLEAAGVDVDAARVHLETVQARFPDLEPFGPTEFGYELTSLEDALPVQVGFFGTHASLGVPYWDLGGGTAELGELVVDIASVVCEATGWVAFDPQEDRVVGLDELASTFGAGHRHGVELTAQIAAETSGEAKPKPKPKRKRFLGLF